MSDAYVVSRRKLVPAGPDHLGGRILNNWNRVLDDPKTKQVIEAITTHKRWFLLFDGQNVGTTLEEAQVVSGVGCLPLRTVLGIFNISPAQFIKDPSLYGATPSRARLSPKTEILSGSHCFDDIVESMLESVFSNEQEGGEWTIPTETPRSIAVTTMFRNYQQGLWTSKRYRVFEFRDGTVYAYETDGHSEVDLFPAATWARPPRLYVTRTPNSLHQMADLLESRVGEILEGRFEWICPCCLAERTYNGAFVDRIVQSKPV